MKISVNSDRVMRVYNHNAGEIKQNAKLSSRSDKIEISIGGKEINKYIEKAKNAEIKNERVDEVKKLIEKGSYRVDSEVLAKSIMDYIKERD